MNCSCPNVRAWRRSYGASWLSVLLTRCWACERRWRSRLHIAGVVVTCLLLPSVVLALVAALSWAVKP